MRVAAVAFAAIAAAQAAACSRALPPDPGASALYRDVQRIVTVRAAAGWQIDRLEVDDSLGDALASVCRATPATRARARDWVDTRISSLGGPVEEAWRARGKRLSRVGELLELWRVKRLLDAAVAAAPADCPFWIEPRDPFAGLQIADDRFQLVLEGGGKGIAVVSEGEVDVAGGGAGRILVGRTFGPRWGVLAGAEIGGSAGFPRDAMGNRGNLELALDAVFPIVVRYRFVNAYLELESGYLAHVTEDGNGVSGIHAGVAVGAKAIRSSWLIPGLALALSVERTFPDENLEPALWLVKLGLRVSIDVDL